MNGPNHLVLASRDLDAQRAFYQGLGFTLCPRGQHPFGTGNTVIQLNGNYLELLSVTVPRDVPDHTPAAFSFAAHNRDYLARHEGFSMLVLGTPDAEADRANWAKSGLKTYEPFEFSRMAKKANGEEVRVGFALTFTSIPSAPWLGLFACQHFAPDYFQQPEYLRHPNTAHSVTDVWISGEGALDLKREIAVTTGAQPTIQTDRITFGTPTGSIVLTTPTAFEDAFGVAPPHPDDGPHLAGYTVGCRSLDSFKGMDLLTVGDRLVVPPSQAYGTAIAFSKLT